ncbi:MAG TPA: hypothetical protein VLG47_04890 [Candidatus Saccharimonadales bacterium]|nr:hypothetical protein [Candidatus Saccharimonadales bacterium]
MKKETGFSAIEAILLLVVVALITGTGWYVWHVRKDTNKLSEETVSQSQPVPKAGDPIYMLDKSKGVINYKNTVGKFSVNYPSNWVHLDTTEKLCGGAADRSLDIGPDKKSIARCGTDGTVSQVSISSVPGDMTNKADYAIFTDKKHDGWVKVVKSTVTADGVTGTFYCGTAQGQGDGLGAYPDGAEVYQDIFVKNNITYTAIYTQYPKSSNEGPTQNQEAAFNKIIGSLKFE